MRRLLLSNNPTRSSCTNEYATVDDVQELFASEMVDLFRLAFLLTADAEKAEHCLILTMHECMASNFVLKWWLPVWTRNTLMRNAIRIVTGSPLCPPRNDFHRRTLSSIRRSERSALDASDESPGFLLLSDFDRLVYVISIVEHYPAGDCAALLERSRQEVRDALNRAVGQVAAFEQEWRRASQRSTDLARHRTKKHPGLMPHARIPSPDA